DAQVPVRVAANCTLAYTSVTNCHHKHQRTTIMFARVHVSDCGCALATRLTSRTLLANVVDFLAPPVIHWARLAAGFAPMCRARSVTRRTRAVFAVYTQHAHEL